MPACPQTSSEEGKGRTVEIENLKKRKSKIDRIKLLNLVKDKGSISSAAKALGVSYKAAWEAVEQINNMSTLPILERTTGGKKGGGTVFTEHGERFLRGMEEFDGKFQNFLDNFGKSSDEVLGQYVQLIRFATSANNQFGGRITKLTIGVVNCEVILDIGEGDTITAMITKSSVKNMGLMEGGEAFALINASDIILTRDKNVKTSARNKLTGVVSWCEVGAVNSEVVIQLPGGKSVTAIITNESLRNLEIKVGDQLTALVKAPHVLLATV